MTITLTMWVYRICVCLIKKILSILIGLGWTGEKNMDTSPTNTRLDKTISLHSAFLARIFIRAKTLLFFCALMVLIKKISISKEFIR